jgi:hypothetical protein
MERLPKSLRFVHEDKELLCVFCSFIRLKVRVGVRWEPRDPYSV